MCGSKWNKLGCTSISRGMGSSHGTVTCWLASASTSFKKWFWALSMSFNVCKFHKKTYRCNGDGWMCEGFLIPWFSPPMLWWGGLDTHEPIAFNMSWQVLWPSILMSTLLSHCCAWSSEFNTCTWLSHQYYYQQW